MRPVLQTRFSRQTSFHESGTIPAPNVFSRHENSRALIFLQFKTNSLRERKLPRRLYNVQVTWVAVPACDRLSFESHGRSR